MLQFIPPIIVLIVYILRMKELATKRDLVAGEIKENLTLKLFKLTGLITVTCAMAEYFLLGRPFNVVALLVGSGCAVASFAIRHQAIRALGRFWSLHVEIRENHQFVKDGPFKFVRHPAYFSMILEIVSVCVILLAPFSMVAALLFFIPVLIKRISLEEVALIEKFGGDYENYRATTPALIPWKFGKS